MRLEYLALQSLTVLCFIGMSAPLVVSGCGDSASLSADDSGKPTIKLTSSAFADGGMIPKTFTCDGADQSPPLQWSGVPNSTRSLALICDDPDAPMGTWSHWVLFNLAPKTTALTAGIPPDETIAVDGGSGRQGLNDFKKVGYGGPCPPSGTHRYYFRLYALDTELKFNSTSTRDDVLAAIRGHILAQGRLLGKYQRGGNN